MKKWTKVTWLNHLQNGSDKKDTSVLFGFLRLHLFAYVCHTRRLWRKQCRYASTGQFEKHVQLDWLHLSRWFFSWVQLFYHIRCGCRRLKGRTENRVLWHWDLWMNIRRRALRRDRTTGVLPNEVESGPERSVSEQHESCSRQRTNILTNTFHCYCFEQFCTCPLS